MEITIIYIYGQCFVDSLLNGNIRKQCGTNGNRRLKTAQIKLRTGILKAAIPIVSNVLHTILDRSEI